MLSNGMYSVIKSNRFIFISSDLEEEMQTVVCNHELGHDTLHRDLAKNTTLQEFVLFDMKSSPEYEANIFDAHILLAEDKIFELHNDAYQIAQMMNIDVNLMFIKMHEINRQGYEFNVPYIPHGDFLEEIILYIALIDKGCIHGQCSWIHPLRGAVIQSRVL